MSWGAYEHERTGEASRHAALASLAICAGLLPATGSAAGDRFWGTIPTASYREDLIGTFTGEEQEFFHVDTDGFADGAVTSADTLRVCYRHINPTSRVAGCSTGTRE